MPPRPWILLLALAAFPFSGEAQTLTRGPYLQNGGTSAITVRWRTGSPTASFVRYGTEPGSLAQSVSETSAKTEHELRLTDLSPDTKYYYSVGNATTALAAGEDCFFLTAPAGAKPTRVWVLGDSGTGSTQQTAVRDAYHQFTAARHTDLWMMLGDNAYDSGTDAEFQRCLFNIYPQMLRKSVLWASLGNHDATSADSSSQTGPFYNLHTFPKQGESGGVASGTEAYYSYDYGNIHFICLDSAESSRSATGAQALWLRNDLEATMKDWIVAFWHHPPYSKGSHNSDSESRMVEMRERLCPILEDYGVDLVLCGHSHSYERSFFIDGHYGSSGTFGESMVVQPGGGGGDEPYTKVDVGPIPHSGAVYAVAGASGKTSGGSLDHPAMFVSLNVLGSMVLDFDGGRLDATYLDDKGEIRDSFSIVKGDGTPPPNHLPTIRITAPAPGSTFSSPADIGVTAAAADSDGMVTQVEFFLNGVPAGTDASTPYGVTLAGIADGAYSLTAVATDNTGATRTSDPVAISVSPPGNQPPAVTLTSPAPGDVFAAPSEIAINAAAYDPDGGITKVEFFAGATRIGIDETAPYAITWSVVGEGDYHLTAVAFDNQGATGRSPVVGVEVSEPGSTKTVAFQNGPGGYAGTVDTRLNSESTSKNYGSSSLLEIDGSPDCAALISWDLQSIPAGKTVTEVTLAFDVDNTSSHTFEVYALKRPWTEGGATWKVSGGGESWQKAGATGDGDRDPTPLGSITGSSEGSYTLALNDAGVARVQAWIDDPAGNFGFIIYDYSNSDGLDLCSSEHTTADKRPKMEVTYISLGDGGGTPPVNQPPAVAITSPSSSTPFTAPAEITVTAAATDSDGSVTKVDFFLNGLTAGTDTSSPYSVILASIPAGSHQLVAVATDNRGTATTSMPVTISVAAPANQPPVVSITSPASGANYSAPAVIALITAVDDHDGNVAKVDFYSASSLIGTDTSAPFIFTWPGVYQGSYSLTAVATDNMGATAASAAIMIHVAPPGAGETTVLQNGVNGYEGATDTRINSESTSRNYGTDTELEIDGSPDSGALIRWDLSPIPQGRRATAATLVFDVAGTSKHTFEIYALKRAWTEGGATWKATGASGDWQNAGATGADDRATTVLGTVTGSSSGTLTIPLGAAGLAQIQAWLDRPAENFGFMIMDYGNSDGLDLYASEYATPARRPKLVITHE